MGTLPESQLSSCAVQKMVVNQATEASGIMQMQRLSTLFDGISRHSPEGLAFKARVETVEWKQAVEERDSGFLIRGILGQRSVTFRIYLECSKKR